MCWSFEASAVFAAIGFAAAGYLAYKKKEKSLWIIVGYFAIMELLQALAYFNLNNCGSPFNQIITYLSYLHIVFQPFFVNAFMMYFIPKETKKRISGWVYALCFIVAISMLVKVYPFAWAGTCDSAGSLCGAQMCSMSGSWHLIWALPLNSMPLVSAAHFFVMFILPIIYGSWKAAVYSFLLGPALAWLLSSSMHEVAAIWCLFSIAIIFAVLFTPLENFLKVRKWYF